MKGLPNPVNGNVCCKRDYKTREYGHSCSVARFECIQEVILNCKIIICGGRGMQVKTIKIPYCNIYKKTQERFPEISNVFCHCANHHRNGCGYMSNVIIKSALNNF